MDRREAQFPGDDGGRESARHGADAGADRAPSRPAGGFPPEERDGAHGTENPYRREPGDDPDRELVQAALEEYPQGTRWFTELVTIHWDLVWTLCQATLMDERAAEDATAQSFLRVHRRLATYRFGERFTAWMCAIARETADQAHSARQRQARPGGPALPVAWLGDWIRQRGSRPGRGGPAVPPRRIFASLSLLERRLLACLSLDGCSADEAAHAVGLEVADLERRLLSARSRLATRMGPADPPHAERATDAGEHADALEARQGTLVRAALGAPDRDRIVRATDEIERQVALEHLAVMLTRSLGGAALEFFDVMLQTYSADARRATAGTIPGDHP